jgi:hypothetical protein
MIDRNIINRSHQGGGVDDEERNQTNVELKQRPHALVTMKEAK